MATAKKVCPKCNKLLPLHRFHVSLKSLAKDRRQPYCKACSIKEVEKWRSKNREKVRSYYLKGKGQRRRHAHKLSKDAEARLYSVKGGRCWICGAEESSRLLCFDHDYDFGSVRGLLCAQCNLAIGNVKDNAALLRRAANYLEGKLVENKKWIQTAIKKPGALKEALGVKKGEKIPAKKLAAAAKKPGKIGQRARLAQTLKKMR